MAKIHELLDEYAESHQNPVNKAIHWICVPLIVWSLLGLLWSIRVPGLFNRLPVPVDFALLVILLSMTYYVLVSMSLAAGILPVFLLMLVSLHILADTGLVIWQVSIGVFILAWIGQFIGHSIEGRRPSFFKDIQFLLIGPLWLLSFVYRRLGIAY